MDRLRVGLTGLGAVFLLTLGASLAFGFVHDGQPQVESHKEPGEPLAQLGVAPGAEKSAPRTAPLPFAEAPFDRFAEPDSSRDYSVIPRAESPVGTVPAGNAQVSPNKV